MLLNALTRVISLIALVGLINGHPVPTSAGSPDIPTWLQKHVGPHDGQITLVVLQRARALYQRKVREGAVSNACYMAMDATRPNSKDGRPGRRFYIICEANQSFRAVSSGHGGGRKLQRAHFRNGRECAKHFGNAEGSNLTAGGVYLTADVRQSFKGYHDRGGERTPFVRPFLIFDGEGETSNARLRDIGGHQAVFLRAQCRYLNPQSSYADTEGYVPFGTLVNYTGGRSNGCATWSPSDSGKIISMIEGNPTTLYLYPESRDIDAVARTVADGRPLSVAGLYWNSTCLQVIGAPQFWPKEHLQPIINEWRQSLPKRPVQKLPICQ